MKKQKDKNNITKIQKGDRIAQCRICGLLFLPELEEDRQHHELEHRKILSGALPYDIREFIKRAAWDILNEKCPADDESTRRHREIAKRAIVFAWWARATANGLPAHEFETYMTDHLADLDARDSGDRPQAEELVNRWRQYGS